MRSRLQIQLAAAIAAIAALMVAVTAGAQAYKCKDAKGRITYSDAPCLGQDTSTVSTSGNTVDGSADRARASRSEDSTSGSRGSQASSGMTEQQRQDRIRELEIESKRSGNSPQQRTAAKREIDALRRGSATQLTPVELEKREDLYKDAGRVDKSTRGQAMRKLEEQTDKYESPEFLKEREAKREEAKRKAAAAAAAEEAKRNASASAVITSCDQGGCWDSLGRRYNGTGATVFRQDGRPCQRVGNQFQCN